MRKHALRILAMLLLICAVLQPLSVRALEPVDTTRKGSLELDYSSNGTGFSDLEIQIYRVAEMYADGTYDLIAPFHRLPVKIHGITSQKEWRDAANTLAAYITAQQLPSTETALTDQAGKAVFTELETGVYLVMGITAETERTVYQFEDFCVFLPRQQSDGTQAYQLRAKPKSTAIPKPEQPEPVQYQVVKLWKDTGIRSQRPAAVTVAILKNGILQETVELNAKNNWTHSWTAAEGEGRWTVVETDVPDAYTVVITESGHVFSITNSRPAPKEAPPKTGDTFALRPWFALMSLSGILLSVCGLLQKKRKAG